MASPSDHQLIQRWENEPAPLLPLLHAFHDRARSRVAAAAGAEGDENLDGAIGVILRPEM